MQSKKQFTLIELIVVIAIVIVLAASAIMILSSYIVKARDTRRSADLRSMQTALETSIISNAKYPFPDGEIKITASGTVIMYQGQFGTTVSKTVNMSKEPKDPGDDTYYTYSVNAAQKKYAIMALMENTVAMNQKNANAINYSTRIPNLAGDKIGILLDSNNMPIQEKKTGIFISVDVRNTTGSYIVFSENNKSKLGTGNAINGFLLAEITDYSNKIYGFDLSVNTTGLVGYWDMETTNSDSKLKDLSNNNNHGSILNGSTFINGKVGQAMNFDGSDDYVDVGNNTNLQLLSDMSISTWIYPINVSTMNSCGIISKCTNGDATCGFELNIRNGLVRFSLGNGVNAPSITASISNNQWYFITAVVSNQTVKLYVNNILKSTMTFNGTRQNPVRNLLIGRYATDYTYNFAGRIDEVRIYNRALSNEEIKALYEASK